MEAVLLAVGKIHNNMGKLKMTGFNIPLLLLLLSGFSRVRLCATP